MTDIIHRVGIRAPISKVYVALATVEGVASWWTRETSARSAEEGSFQVLFRNPAGVEIGGMQFEVARHAVDREVRWRCVSGPPEWIGTDVTFELSEIDGDTIVLFGHRNWQQPGDFMAHCSTKWATFLLSLKALVETGQGRPAPDDLKIDNWN